MIDLHTHVLPGLDDGAETVSDAVELAARLMADGATVIAATPHVRADYPTTPELMRSALGLVRDELGRRGLALEVVEGGEVSLDRLAGDRPAAVARPFGLGGSRYVLVEFPHVGWPRDLSRILGELLSSGLRPVLAHPERNPEIQAAPARLAPLVEQGVVIQITAGSALGTFGRSAQETSAELVSSGLAHLLASDAHGAADNRTSLVEALAAVSGAELGRWLVEDVPRAILADWDELPLRPASPRRRRWRRGRVRPRLR